MGEQVPDVVERIVEVYRRERRIDEPFSEVVARIGVEAFKEHVYAAG
jgi:sulfite reductase (NADPH) hemoprotein beta-component